MIRPTSPARSAVPFARPPQTACARCCGFGAAPGFVSFHCARCGESGFVREAERRSVDREALRRFQAEAAAREQAEAAVRRAKALALWQRREPLAGTPAEAYLRQPRGIACVLPATLGYLPPRGDYRSALIAAFGIPDEPAPGLLAIADQAVVGVHLTKLKPDGSGKAEAPGQAEDHGRPPSSGFPIVLAPPNDSLGLAIAEGIEDALSIHEATGLGAWAAGAAGRLPKLAARIPAWIDCVTIAAHADPARRPRAPSSSPELLAERGIETLVEGLP